MIKDYEYFNVVKFSHSWGKHLIKFDLFIILIISRDSGFPEGKTVFVKLCLSSLFITMYCFFSKACDSVHHWDFRMLEAPYALKN